MQPDKKARRESTENALNIPTTITIPGTRRKVKLSGVKPYTIERLTLLWQERDANIPEDSSDTLKNMCVDPYFAVKSAVLFVLNSYWKIVLFYPIMWRIWAKWRGYTDEQMMPIIMEGKKKIPLTAHWTVMAFSVDMRTDWMNLTKKEAEQYQAERLLAVKQLSSRNSQNTEKQEDSSSD
nr:MAG TPA: hypothetical protein [Caudoviricetes sp.]